MSKYGPKIQSLSFLAKDPEVRYKPDGTKIINLLVNDTPIRPGTKNGDKNRYIGEQIWLVAEAWAEKLEKGRLCFHYRKALHYPVRISRR